MQWNESTAAHGAPPLSVCGALIPVESRWPSGGASLPSGERQVTDFQGAHQVPGCHRDARTHGSPSGAFCPAVSRARGQVGRDRARCAPSAALLDGPPGCCSLVSRTATREPADLTPPSSQPECDPSRELPPVPTWTPVLKPEVPQVVPEPSSACGCESTSEERAECGFTAGRGHARLCASRGLGPARATYWPSRSTHSARQPSCRLRLPTVVARARSESWRSPVKFVERARPTAAA